MPAEKFKGANVKLTNGVLIVIDFKVDFIK